MSEPKYCDTGCERIARVSIRDLIDPVVEYFYCDECLDNHEYRMVIELGENAEVKST